MRQKQLSTASTADSADIALSSKQIVVDHASVHMLDDHCKWLMPLLLSASVAGDVSVALCGISIVR